MKKFKNWVVKVIGILRGAKPSSNVTFNKKNARKFLFLQRMYENIRALDGAVVECGVGTGKSFRMLGYLIDDDKRKLIGFDSFEGFPEPSVEDDSFRKPKNGEWKFDLEELKKSVDFDCEIVKGFFNETLPKYDMPPIALLNLDVDLYDSYKTCLSILFPKVIEGGIVVFDEYEGKDSVKFPGAKKAIDEYFDGKGYLFEKDEKTGKYFVRKI